MGKRVELSSLVLEMLSMAGLAAWLGAMPRRTPRARQPLQTARLPGELRLWRQDKAWR